MVAFKKAGLNVGGFELLKRLVDSRKLSMPPISLPRVEFLASTLLAAEIKTQPLLQIIAISGNKAIASLTKRDPSA